MERYTGINSSKFMLPEVKDAISRKPVGVKSRKSSDSNCVLGR